MSFFSIAQIKAMLADILPRELASDDDEDWRRL
jgi:hypothetical protein